MQSAILIVSMNNYHEWIAGFTSDLHILNLKDACA